MRAKAMFELGKNKEAVKGDGDVSTAADQLRADIYWRAQNYQEAALQCLPAGRCEGKYDQLCATRTDWAVAMRRIRMKRLKLARTLWASTKNGLRDAFRYIVIPKTTVTGDLEGISKRITEIDQFEAFLNNYRERLYSG